MCGGKVRGVGCILRLKKFNSEDEDHKTHPRCNNPVCEKLSEPMALCQLGKEDYGHPIVLGVYSEQKMGGGHPKLT